MYYWYNEVGNNFISSEEPNKSYVPQIIWVITDKCNYRCPFCFQPKTGTDVPFTLFDKYLSVFQRLGVQKIDISGGEPLYFRHLPNFAEKLREHGIFLTISSNGSGLDSNRQWLACHHALFSRVILSLNGANEHQHDALCGSAGAYRRLLSLIDLLKDKGCSNLRINTVITKAYLNQNHVDGLIDTVKRIAPAEWCLIQPHPENKQKSFDEYALDDNPFHEIVNAVKERFPDMGVRIVSRSVKNYSGYWVLNPDNTFLLHTDGIRKSIWVKMESDFAVTASEILRHSEEYGLWLPS